MRSFRRRRDAPAGKLARATRKDGREPATTATARIKGDEGAGAQGSAANQEQNTAQNQKKQQLAGNDSSPTVEVRRSSRRTRTVTAYRERDTIVVLIPQRMSKADEQTFVRDMVEKVLAREARATGAAERRSVGPTGPATRSDVPDASS